MVSMLSAGAMGVLASLQHQVDDHTRDILSKIEALLKQAKGDSAARVPQEAQQLEELRSHYTSQMDDLKQTIERQMADLRANTALVEQALNANDQIKDQLLALVEKIRSQRVALEHQLGGVEAAAPSTPRDAKTMDDASFASPGSIGSVTLGDLFRQAEEENRRLLREVATELQFLGDAYQRDQERRLAALKEAQASELEMRKFVTAVEKDFDIRDGVLQERVSGLTKQVQQLYADCATLRLKNAELQRVAQDSYDRSIQLNADIKQEVEKMVAKHKIQLSEQDERIRELEDENARLRRENEALRTAQVQQQEFLALQDQLASLRTKYAEQSAELRLSRQREAKPPTAVSVRPASAAASAAVGRGRGAAPAPFSAYRAFGVRR